MSDCHGRLEAFLDRAGIGDGPLRVQPVGDGHSNLTFLLHRGDERLILRRPPRGPLAPSANDVLREARLLQALAPTMVPVPEILATCEDEGVIGAPFYLMSFVEGHALVDRLPPGLGPGAPRRVAEELVETLAELHAVDLQAIGSSSFGSHSAYLERQLRRFSGLLEHNATRPLPDLERVSGWLRDNCPPAGEATLVHGDFRLGNMMFAGHEPRLVAVLDWELATIGDPLADIGYCTAMWAEPNEESNPMLDLSRVTRLPGFPGRDELAQHYARLTGRDLGALGWYRVLAIWKAAIFLEGSYGRYRAGESEDEYFARLGEGVPALGRLALGLTTSGGW